MKLNNIEYNYDGSIDYCDLLLKGFTHGGPVAILTITANDATTHITNEGHHEPLGDYPLILEEEFIAVVSEVIDLREKLKMAKATILNYQKGRE